MTETFLALVPTYGPVLLGVATYFSCFGAPIPASILMLAAGAFVASGDLVLGEIILAAFLGAILGDWTGFAIGRRFTHWLERAEDRHPKWSSLSHRARMALAQKGGWAVFFSRWLFAQLGPALTYAAGTAGMSWRRFLLPQIAGEVLWVGIYVGLGYAFARHISDVSLFASSVSAALAAAGCALMLGGILWWWASNQKADARRKA